ncbi:acyl-CoA thioesterase [Leptolyngbya sp. NIES-2104]|uniref:acyl-CoA thioesterase n=1 Tax=Leptolyngbya sp. NIES-2104 TaxID=1552121 RepID=UPI0006ECCE92|nr:thioesterase family protein [Leptolyngbya sp. NIES-2104]GAP93996.1 1,4-dihydroxy-2-naphthoyl-CoA hydrolase in phylloquinone biosynthesis [Leptolyngbya sp. NIES-2104]
MAFTYSRSIHFSDTDAAGVVYFANIFNFCHEAYEASLAASGIDLRSFFSGQEIAVPIVHAEVDFFKPMFCGDQITIALMPNLLKPSEFEISYHLFNQAPHHPIAKALTRHVCIDPKTRSRQELLPVLLHWLNGANE